MYKPEQNDGKHIFVFGSNRAGIHGAGAASTAHKHWGAAWGVGEGRTGQAYALPTKSKRIGPVTWTSVASAIDRFLRYAGQHPELTFLVTAVGCGLAGYSPRGIGPLFENAPPNCILPPGWRAKQYESLAQHCKTLFAPARH